MWQWGEGDSSIFGGGGQTIKNVGGGNNRIPQYSCFMNGIALKNANVMIMNYYILLYVFSSLLHLSLMSTYW